MSLDHYYQSELTALRQLGKEFAERNPALAPFLAERGRDPDVERLFEGFAFLTGRIRQKLDDELPELTHSLMNLLWPNYMRPLPGFSIVQFEPQRQSSEAIEVVRHTPLESEAVEGVRCKFRTAYHTQVLPLAPTRLDYSAKGDGALLSLCLSMTVPGNLGEITFDQLRLHLAGDAFISQLLYLSLLRFLGGIELVLTDAQGEACASIALGPSNLKPVGFEEEHALIPYPLNTFRGYRHLQEYFSFPAKFMFLDLTGLACINRQPQAVLEKTCGLELRFDIRKAGVQRILPTLDNLKLYCTPVVNLFAHDANPIRLDGKRDRYLLQPSGYAAQHCNVFSVDAVQAHSTKGRSYIDLVPFESFEHDASFDVPNPAPHFTVRQQPSALGRGLDSYLIFGPSAPHLEETVSVELTCTNHDLPRQLAAGDIRFGSDPAITALGLRNICPVTPSYAPPVHRDFLWRLISNMSLNYLSLANIEALKVILQTYDLPRYHDQAAARISDKTLAGLKHIQHQAVDHLYRGLPVCGVRTELLMDSASFANDGAMFLFASVLNEFFALYTSLNSFHELQVTSLQGEVFTWTPRMGQQPLL